MNFYSKNEDIKKAVTQLLGGSFSNIAKVNFGVDYAHNRRISIVTISLSPSSIVHGLVFFYTRGLSLYDAVVFRNKRFYRIGRGSEAFKRVEKINRIVLTEIPKTNPYMARELSEDADYQVQHLKDQLRIKDDMIRSLHNQIKNLKSN